MDRKSCWSLFRFGFGLLARSPWAPAGFAKASPSAGREALPLIIFRYQNQKTRPGALIELWRALDSPFYRSSVPQTNQVDLARALIPRLVSRFQRFFVDHDHLQTKTDTVNGVPRFYWHYNDGIPHSIHAEDIGHGSLDMQYLDA